MKTILCISFAVGLIAIASALTCKKCDFRVWSMCLSESGTTECSGNCSVIRASIGGVSMFSKLGCATTTCEGKPNQTDNVFGFHYVNTCCNTDQCNSGNSIKISLSLGLGMGLLWLLNAM